MEGASGDNEQVKVQTISGAVICKVRHGYRGMEDLIRSMEALLILSGRREASCLCSALPLSRQGDGARARSILWMAIRISTVTAEEHEAPKVVGGNF